MTIDASIALEIGSFALDVDVQVGAGEVLAVLGPNGSGKSTLLRVIAGLAAVDRGRVVVDGVVLDDPSAGVFVAPETRRVGLMFQDYILFPHLRAVDNIAFGLRCRGASKHDARVTAREWLDRFDLTSHADARPDSLSGGEAQRVALARALAAAPRALLLDEPFAALDVGTRAAVRRDVRQHLDGFAGATILVTHDPLDALAMATRVLILETGHVTQCDSIDEITQRPRSRYVADLIGLNLLRGHAEGGTVQLDDDRGSVTIADHASGRVHVLIRPQAVAVHTEAVHGSPRNQWRAWVEGFDLLGDRVRVRLAGPVPLVAEITPAAVRELDLREGQDVWATVKATEVDTYPV